MIFVDTSVWVDYFNGVSSPQVNELDRRLDHEVVAMGDLILLEILQGFNNDRHYNLARERLLQLAQHEFLNYRLALKASENFRYLRKKGIKVRKSNDVIIATYCIEYGVPLLFSDRDFEPFVKHLGLQAV